MERVVIADNGCWNWDGPVFGKGYGKIRHGSRLEGVKNYAVHRVIYEHQVGPIPEGLTIDHLCENKRCVNPYHLEAVTNAENLRRMSSRMTTCRKGHPRTPENVYVNPNSGKHVCRICRGW